MICFKVCKKLKPDIRVSGFFFNEDYMKPYEKYCKKCGHVITAENKERVERGCDNFYIFEHDEGVPHTEDDISPKIITNKKPLFLVALFLLIALFLINHSLVKV